jgi:hypothetical protein
MLLGADRVRLEIVKLADNMARGSGPKVGAILFFLAGDLIFQSPQNSEKNRQTVNKKRLFY